MTTTNYVQTTFSVMTKASIVQRLLDEKLITAEEAVVLLQNETPIVNVPQPFPAPVNPWTPINPWNPFVTYCGTTLEGKK
jgi:hypothetical protein